MIKASADGEIRTLIEQLDSDEAVRREAAIARLSIIGRRAVDRLVSAYDSTTRSSKQLAILRVLETSGDERALAVARRGLGAGGDVGVAAVAVLGELLERGAGSTHARALESLLGVSSDPALARRLRAAAAHALSKGPRSIRAAITPSLAALGTADDALWDDAAEGRLPDDPSALAQSLEGHAGEAALPILRRIIESVKLREQDLPASPLQAEWRAVRGALHQALAARGSRIALYDLRETIGAAREPLPPAFLAALEEIGDESALEPLGDAYVHAPEGQEAWRQGLADAFQAVVQREHLTRKHSAVRRALAKAPALGR